MLNQALRLMHQAPCRIAVAIDCKESGAIVVPTSLSFECVMFFRVPGESPRGPVGEMVRVCAIAHIMGMAL
jgi:hypothetical protein